MKFACFSVLFALTCVVASGQPMVVPSPYPPSFPQPAAPDGRPVLPQRGPRLGPEGEDLAPMGDDPAEDAAPPKDCYRVSLDDGSLILGQIDPKTKVTLRSKVGELAIALPDVARIDPAFPDETKFTLTLSNGDRLTGSLSFKEIQFQTALGEMPLQAKGLYSLEAGKLHEQTRSVSRRSLDGRTVVTVARKYVRFQANAPDPHAPVSHGPTYAPSHPTPHAAEGWHVQPGAPATIYVPPASAPPSLAPVRPTRRPDTPSPRG